MDNITNEENIKGLPKIRRWVARQPNGSLWLYDNKPHFIRDYNVWGSEIGREIELEDITDPTIFSDLTWESEPVEVELLIKKI